MSHRCVAAIGGKPRGRRAAGAGRGHRSLVHAPGRTRRVAVFGLGLAGIAAATSSAVVSTADASPDAPRASAVGALNGMLSDVSVSAKARGWAVGASAAPGKSTTGLLVPIAGQSLGRPTDFSLPGCSVVLDGVATIGSHDAWAAGYSQPLAGKNDQLTTGLLLHYAGSSWNRVTLPGAATLAVIAAGGASAVWAGGTSTAGGPVAYQYNGKGWTARPLPLSGSARQGSISGIAVLTPKEVVVDGTYRGQFLAYRWLSGAWSRLTTPVVPRGATDAGFSAASATSARNLWLAGNVQLSSGVRQTTLVHYVGADYLQPTFEHGAVVVDRVFTLGRTATWLSGVGSSSAPALYFSSTAGASWHPVSLPVPAGDTGALTGLAFSKSNAGWVVGLVVPKGSSASHPYVARIVGGRWTVMT